LESFEVIYHMLHTANHTDSEEPYYSTVYAGQSDAIEMKENDAVFLNSLATPSWPSQRTTQMPQSAG